MLKHGQYSPPHTIHRDGQSGYKTLLLESPFSVNLRHAQKGQGGSKAVTQILGDGVANPKLHWPVGTSIFEWMGT